VDTGPRAIPAETTSGPPDWIRGALVSALDELRAFARTLWGISARPTSFIRAWCEGGERALNPLAFAATSAAIVALATTVLGWLGYGSGGEGGFLSDVVHQTGPFVQYTVVGLLAHPPLAFAKPRRRLRDTVAVALYAGGPALCGYVVLYVALAALWLLHGRPPVANGLSTMLGPWGRRVVLAGGYSVIALFVRSLWLGLAGLYGGRRGPTAAATAFAVIALALALGAAHESGPYGFQFVIERRDGGWWPGIHD
jgi:hypothetical protein